MKGIFIMEKLRSFFESKWAVLLAFVPVVQVFYFLFAFLVFRKDSLKFRIGGPVVFVAAGFLTHLFLPWGWLGAYVCFTVLALVSLKAIRDSDYRINKSFWIRLAAVALPVLLFLLVFVFLKPYGPEREAFLREQTYLALEAVMNDDMATWRELEYDDSALSDLNWLSLRELRSKLAEKDSLPRGEIGELMQTYSFRNLSLGIPCYGATYNVAIGGVMYEVSIYYTESSTDTGISHFDITKID